MTQTLLSRRGFLTRSVAAGCSLAASPLVTPVSFAATGGDNRLVVIILRGGLDGLDLLRPPNSEMMRKLRPTLGSAPSDMELEQGFTLHPACAPLWPLWQAGELDFVQAVSTPYRHKRSHFDGQDLLEAGTVTLEGAAEKDGWLNRMLLHMPGAEMTTAYAIGVDPMLLARGAAQVESWSPDVDFVLSAQGARLMALTMEQDPRMAAALSQAFALVGESGDGGVFEFDDTASMDAELGEMVQAQANSKPPAARKAHVRVARFAAERLREDARVACFSLGGWDSHANQAVTLKSPLARLSDSLLTLKADLGADVWGKTTVLAMTEFGRTVAENGTRGTDHGTGGAMILAGGALRGRRILGNWPGLEEADLFERRDLMPTDDVRRYAAWAIRESFGVSASALETTVFPGLSLAENPALLA